MKTRIALIALAVLGTCLVGCSGDKGRTVSSNPNTERDEINRIKNDPNMPQQAKDAALRGMQEGKLAAQQMQRRQTP
jgi:outer membrane murein-binding lipoprotein Lpp